jgi:CelD/BcsL family acetyltransferase involved in cellulose biosynthesis
VGQAADTIVHARANAAETRPPAPYPALAERGAITLSAHDNLAGVEQIWRAFQQTADCTPFQTFDWLSAWQRHIGALSGVTPAIVIGRRGDEILFLLPLGVERGTFTRRLTFLGQDLCDYNAPLLAPDFARLSGSTCADCGPISAHCCRQHPRCATTPSRLARCRRRSARSRTRW